MRMAHSAMRLARGLALRLLSVAHRICRDGYGVRSVSTCSLGTDNRFQSFHRTSRFSLLLLVRLHSLPQFVAVHLHVAKHSLLSVGEILRRWSSPRRQKRLVVNVLVVLVHSRVARVARACVPVRVRPTARRAVALLPRAFATRGRVRASARALPRTRACVWVRECLGLLSKSRLPLGLLPREH